MEESMKKTAVQNVTGIIRDVFEYREPAKAIVVADDGCPLSKILAEAYKEALPNAEHLAFSEEEAPQILAAFASLKEGDLVILIQSGSFRLNEFRIRVELFKKGLKVLEHPHLDRMKTEKETEIYLDSLHYDKEYYRGVGAKLKERIDQAKEIVVESTGGALRYEGPFEDAKLNVGDYGAMKNWGGQFPIGEVFTEPKMLERVNGTVALSAFGDRHFLTNVPPTPVLVTIENGVVTGVSKSTPEFDAVIAEIKEEEVPVLRELGFGMNRAFTNERVVADIGTYERKCGIHFSLGGKHAMYAKEGFSRKHSRFHVDVFADVTRVLIDGVVVFEGGGYTL